MTEKELIYIEDLLGAEELAKKVCDCHSRSIEDSQLKEHILNLALSHEENIKKLYNLLK